MMTTDRKNVSVRLNYADIVRQVIYGNIMWFMILHNHALSHKLVDHPIVCHLILAEKELVSNMTLNTVRSKNVLATLK